jgi:hypothetical protein
MLIRGRLDKVLRAAEARLASIDPRRGGPFYYDPEAEYARLFVYNAAITRAVRTGTQLPRPPRILEVIADLPTPERREAGLEQLYRGVDMRFVAFDWPALVVAGEIRPRTEQRSSPGPEDQGGPDHNNVQPIRESRLPE